MKERKGHLVGKVVSLAVIFSGIAAAILVIVGIFEVRSTYLNLIEEELHVSVMQADSEFSSMWDGDWAYNDGIITKGEEEVYDEYLEAMLELKKETNIDYTIFYGDTRAVTTLKKADGSDYLINTQAAPAVVEAVINQGKTAYKPNITIEGQKYYGYYAPLTNSDGSVVGMMFTGRESSDVSAALLKITLVMVIVGVLSIIVLIVLGIIASKKSEKAMNSVSGVITTLASGDLTQTVPEELILRNDEVGTMAESAKNLGDKLRDIIGLSVGLAGDVTRSGDELASSAEQASMASNQVTDAVDEISKGAVSQAESVQDSATNVGEIGSDIDTVRDNVTTLNNNTSDMQEACDNSMKALNQLLEQNENVIRSMKEIDEQIRNTNSAVQNIAEASKLITDIASQTNLLALNASIEAARAGESGKGFAVVATEIGALADQSRQAAVDINDTIKELTVESEKSVNTIVQLNEELDEQSKHLDSTKHDMERMQEGVSSVYANAGEISTRVENLDSSKGNLADIIEDLSAISQENAASTEQTNASMEELNATFEIINKSADDLRNLASQLNDAISFFKLDMGDDA